MHYLMPVVQLYIFLAQWRLVLSESAVYLFGYCCIIGQQTNVEWNALVPLVSNGNKHRCTYVHLKIFILVDVVTLLYMYEVK